MSGTEMRQYFLEDAVQEVVFGPVKLNVRNSLLWRMARDRKLCLQGARLSYCGLHSRVNQVTWSKCNSSVPPC